MKTKYSTMTTPNDLARLGVEEVEEVQEATRKKTEVGTCHLSLDESRNGGGLKNERTNEALRRRGAV